MFLELWHNLYYTPLATKLPFSTHFVLVPSHACGLEASTVSNGEERLAEQTGHHNQFDQPQLVVDAILGVLERS